MTSHHQLSTAAALPAGVSVRTVPYAPVTPASLPPAAVLLPAGTARATRARELVRAA